MFEKIFKKKEKDKKPKVVVGVMIFKNEKVLIGKRRNRHGNGEYSFPGGHLEYGQAFEDCVRQEVLEEAGIGIKNIRFLSIVNSIKHYDRHEVQLHFSADWESGEPRDLPEERIGDWSWYDLNNLPEPFFFPAEMTVKSYKENKNYYDKE
jgi:8-oxo-dGTP diphosphatase